MIRALALLVAALHLAVASLPCPPSAPSSATRAEHAAHAAGALHATHGAAPAGEAPGELRAPCPCGCRHGAAAPAAFARLGPALLAAAPAAAPPVGRSLLAAEPAGSARARAAAPDPVPRAA
jgi:hypothetical protein